jgi:hypothetical protein
MAGTFYRNVCDKIKPDMDRAEKELIMHESLIKTDRVYVQNIREGDLFNYYGSETSLKFLRQIKEEEKKINRRLTATEIENVSQEMIGSLKNGNGRIH